MSIKLLTMLELMHCTTVLEALKKLNLIGQIVDSEKEDNEENVVKKEEEEEDEDVQEKYNYTKEDG